MPLPITLAPDPVHLVFWTQHTSMFILCNVSTTSAVQTNVPGWKPYAVWNIRSILPHPTSFPAGHRVYVLHNDGNSSCSLSGCPIVLFLVGRWGCPRGTRSYIPPIFVVIYKYPWIKRNWSKVFVARCPSCRQPAGITRWISSFL